MNELLAAKQRLLCNNEVVESGENNHKNSCACAPMRNAAGIGFYQSKFAWRAFVLLGKSNVKCLRVLIILRVGLADSHAFDGACEHDLRL